MKWWEISWFFKIFIAPSSVFLTFSWEISDNIIILRFCNIVEGQAKCINAPTIFKKGKLEDFVHHAFVEIKQLKGGKEIKKNVPLNGTIRYQDNENTE